MGDKSASHLLEIGKPYSPTRTVWPDGADLNFWAGGYELRLFLADPTPEEVNSIRTGKPEFGFWQVGSVIFFVYRFGDMAWSDQPYSWHLQREISEELPVEPEELERHLLTVLLVDGDTGILKVIRQLTFSPHFSRLFAAAVHAQAHQKWNSAEFDRECKGIYTRFTSEDIVKVAQQRAVAREV